MTLAGTGSFDPRGPLAEAILDLWWLMLVLGVAVFVLFAVLLGGALFRRGDEGQDAHTPARSSRLVGRWVVAGGVVLPVVVITVVYVATLVAMREVPATASADALTVEIVGHQFWYEVRYPDAGVVTANEVHIPVGRPVEFHLTSTDVIHSFWVPELGGKMDLLPDGTNTLVLEATEPGTHKARCAEFCGIQHARMILTFVSEPVEDFDAWIASYREPADAPDTAAARQGQDVFFAKDCARCHAIAGTAAAGRDGPSLTHIGSRPTLGAGTLENTPENLAAWIRDPQQFKAGAEMPATDMSVEELSDLVAYLEGLE